MAEKYYTVISGRKPGVYDNWCDCQEQTNGFPGAEFKSYPTQELAQQALIRNDTILTKTPDSVTSVKLKSIERLDIPDYEVNSLSVDAACSGNPGQLEYQCVDTDTGVLLFDSPVYPIGTNNIGEFLALVQAMRHSVENNLQLPIYTDSITAISWVRKRRINTTLARNPDTKDLIASIDKAIDWLFDNTRSFDIRKWNTKEWGESKADFGRK